MNKNELQAKINSKISHIKCYSLFFKIVVKNNKHSLYISSSKNIYILIKIYLVIYLYAFIYIILLNIND